MATVKGARAKAKAKADDGRRHGKNIRNKVIPAIVTALSLVIIVVVMGYLNFDLRYGLGASGIVFASFGGSAFALFMLPYSRTANVKRFVKSYIIGGILGYIGYIIVPYIGLAAATGAVVLVVSLLLVATGSEHPPALGIAFAFVLYRVDYIGIVVVMVAVLVLSFMRLIMLKYVYVIEKDTVRTLETIEKRIGGT
jgi:CBS-domain-containing membrane protein